MIWVIKVRKWYINLSVVELTDWKVRLSNNDDVERVFKTCLDCLPVLRADMLETELYGQIYFTDWLASHQNPLKYISP